MATYPFFKTLIKLGKKDDPLHNSLHHYLKYLDNYTENYYQTKTINLLLENGLSMEEEDSEGYTGNDYLNEKKLSPEDLTLTKHYTKEYKTLENILLQKINHILEKCEICKSNINIYNTMLNNIEICKEYTELIKNITELREKCISIFKRDHNISASHFIVV
jgi:hypothetical protein